jgi:putative selenium metabolism protein SsnA
MPITLTNGTIASLSPRSVKRADVQIEGDRIARTGEVLVAGGELVDCSGKLIIPGNVCAHTHLYSALARGMPAPPRSPRNFPEILELIWWRLDRALDEESIRASGQVGILDAIRAGTTTLVDHHASPDWIDGSLDLLAESFRAAGMRGVLCYEVTDRGGLGRRDAGLRENERFLTQPPDGLVCGMVGAHASFTLSDESLEALAGMAQSHNAGIHIHVAEDVSDEEDSERRCGKRTALRLRDAGIFSERSIAAHGVHLDEQEIAAARERRSWFVHNCRSNLNNGVGRAAVDAFGPRTALGTDGIDGDMFAESRTAYFRAREDSLDAYAEQFTDRLAAGCELASEQFGFPVGTFEPGAAADLVVLDYQPPTPLHGENLAWHWMFSFGAHQVESVMIAGQWVLRNRKFPLVDEERIRIEARVQATRLWQRMQEL